ncbi:MAG: hypothetical protein ABSC42_14490 [Tepidisphaeraceae bacterium]
MHAALERRCAVLALDQNQPTKVAKRFGMAPAYSGIREFVIDDGHLSQCESLASMNFTITCIFKDNYIAFWLRLHIFEPAVFHVILIVAGPRSVSHLPWSLAIRPIFTHERRGRTMYCKTIPMLASGTFSLSAVSIVALVLSAGAVLAPATARGQLFIATGSTIGEYNLDGTTVNPSLVSGLNFLRTIAVSGNDIFVANLGLGTIGEYTASGATVNAALISGLNNPEGIAVEGNNLFVANEGNGTVGKYTTSGAVENATLISGLPDASAIAVDGNNLFVPDQVFYQTDIGEYTTAGELENASFIRNVGNPWAIVASGGDVYVSDSTGGYVVGIGGVVVSGLSYPAGLAIDGNDLFVASEGTGTIGEYNTSGATVNGSLVSGLQDYPTGIAVLVPEPATESSLLITGAGVLMRRRRAQLALLRRLL